MMEMGFEKTLTFNYKDLDRNTMYRFAEIEMKHAMDLLQKAYKHTHFPQQKAVTMLFDMVNTVEENKEEREDFFREATLTRLWNNPLRNELIDYFRYRNISYRRIMTSTGFSPNTIAKRKYEEAFYTPVYQKWDAAMLVKWDEVKSIFNLFGETVIHLEGIEGK
jgi:hypothetical protein